jgi:hypothetical protein
MATIANLRIAFEKAKLEESTMTFRQGKYLWHWTGLKFWEPEQIPAPFKKQASVLIDCCIHWNTARGDEKVAYADLTEEFIKNWFPEWDKSKLYIRVRKGNSQELAPEEEMTSKPEGNS